MIQVFFFLSANASEDIWRDVELTYLKGLKSIAVGDTASFQFWGEYEKELMIPKQKIKNLIECKFRMSGIEVFDRRQHPLRRDAADLSVDFKFLKIEPQYGVIYISFRIYETGHIERNNLYTSGKTWERFAMLTYSKNPDSEKEIVNLINDWMDEFSNLYLEANPRKFIPEDD